MKTFLHRVVPGLLLALLLSSTADAQYAEDEQVRATEFGFLGGASLYYGDLSASQRNYLKEATPHLGVFVRGFLSTHASIRANFYVGRLEGNDGWYAEPVWRKHRNFYFNSMVLEASLLFEYDLLRGRRLEKGSGFDIYLFAGAGLCYTDPQRNFNNIDRSYFAADDEAVAGYQADFYKNPHHVAAVVPLGMGLRQRIGKRTAAFVELGLHQGLDDRIDGFSNSVSSGKFDAYSFASLGIAIRMQRH